MNRAACDLGSQMALALAGLALLAGCGDDLPTTYPVSGTVTHNGQPVAGAEVVFVATKSEPGQRPARGTTDEQGRFTLSTYRGPERDDTGALPGTYQVTVTKRIEPPGGVDPYQGRVARNELPARYAAPTSSGLTATITAEGPNTYSFDLSGDP